tara:strand:+ start:69 stop:584 length:516 start_codon:yes stop_codon:yes gene_type:complete
MTRKLIIHNNYYINTLIHYSKSVFDISKIETIKNRGWGSKPKGGLWTCPSNSRYSWKAYIDLCEMDLGSFMTTLRIPKAARIYTVDSLASLRDLWIKYPFKNNECDGHGNALNWESIAKDFDVFHLTVEGLNSTHLPEIGINGMHDYIDLYGWDCETILILNAKMVEVKTL